VVAVVTKPGVTKPLATPESAQSPRGFMRGTVIIPEVVDQTALVCDEEGCPE
jgi:hypothetical protein